MNTISLYHQVFSCPHPTPDCCSETILRQGLPLIPGELISLICGYGFEYPTHAFLTTAMVPPNTIAYCSFKSHENGYLLSLEPMVNDYSSSHISTSTSMETGERLAQSELNRYRHQFITSLTSSVPLLKAVRQWNGFTIYNTQGEVMATLIGSFIGKYFSLYRNGVVLADLHDTNYGHSTFYPKRLTVVLDGSTYESRHPRYIPTTSSYIGYFEGGRITNTSDSNLVIRGSSNQLMWQFGKGVEDYILDFDHSFSPLTAFAMGLAVRN